MTVSSTTARVSYAGSGSTGPFSITFTILDEDHVLAKKKTAAGVESTLVITTDYTVNSDLDELTLVVALAVGETLTLTRSVPLTQLADYQPNSAFPAEVNEDALDKLTQIAQQIDEAQDRGIVFQSTTAISTPIEVNDDPTDGQYLRWDTTNGYFTWQTLTSSAGIGDVVDDITPQLGGNLDENGKIIYNASANFTIGDGTDLTKLADFDLSGATTAKTVTFTSSHTDDRTITFPDATDTLVGKATTDILTNKTLTSGVLNTAVSGTAVLDEDDMSSDSATQLATQQSIKAYVDTNVTGNAPTSVQVFTSSGTWTKPAGITKVVVEVVGGGGGGAGAASASSTSAGGAGGYSKELITSGLSSSETVTIGAGGTAGAAGGNNGSSGGTTSFGSFCSATGGGGGFTNGTGGTGGTATGGTINITGNTGGSNNNPGSTATGSEGAGSFFGGGGRGGAGSGGAGVDGTGGGGAGATNNTAGGDGGDGIVIVWEYTS